MSVLAGKDIGQSPFGSSQKPTHVLEAVDLDLFANSIVTLIGPNGAGKSTLLKVVLGLQAPESGAVRRKQGLVVGYVPQRLKIDPIFPLTVRRFLSLPKKRREDEILTMLEEVGAAYIIDQPVQDLSGGEAQRMLLARALLRRPDLLILDEPLQGVDFSGQISLFKLIERLRHDRGCGIIMVSHDLHIVMAGTDRVICLNRHICCSGQPESVSQHPEYLALFGPQAATGLAVYSHSHDHHHNLSGDLVSDHPKPDAGEACQGHHK